MMTRPRPPLPNYLRQASNARRWVIAVAQREERSPRAVSFQYRTLRGLAPSIAAILRAWCHAEAVRLVREGEEAPTGTDLLDRTVATYYARYLPLKQAHERAQADATVAEIRRMQG